MTKARVMVSGVEAGILEKVDDNNYVFTYNESYKGAPVSLTMPLTRQRCYHFAGFPPFFDGLLPEGVMLEALLRHHKLDRHDYFGQLLKVGKDMVGCVTVEKLT